MVLFAEAIGVGIMTYEDRNLSFAKTISAAVDGKAIIAFATGGDSACLRAAKTRAT